MKNAWVPTKISCVFLRVRTSGNVKFGVWHSEYQSLTGSLEETEKLLCTMLCKNITGVETRSERNNQVQNDTNSLISAKKGKKRFCEGKGQRE